MRLTIVPSTTMQKWQQNHREVLCMAELPMREQNVCSWGAAAPAWGHNASPPHRQFGAVYAHRRNPQLLPQHAMASRLPPDTQGKGEKQVAMLPREFYTEWHYCADIYPRIKSEFNALIISASPVCFSMPVVFVFLLFNYTSLWVIMWYIYKVCDEWSLFLSLNFINAYKMCLFCLIFYFISHLS